MHLNSAIAWSFSKKPKKTEFIIEKKFEVPGPGNYDEEAFKRVKQNKMFSFGKEPKDIKIRSTTPGPGHYDKHTDNLFGKDYQMYSPSKTPRPKKGNLNNSMETELTSGRLITHIPNTPGPGQYDIDSSLIEKTKKKTVSYKIGKSTKEINYKNNIPGPGEYNVGKTIGTKSKAWSISKSNRDNILLKEKKMMKDIPGPGMYNVSSTVGEGRKVVLKGKDYYRPVNKNPGPGAYSMNIDSVVTKSPGWK